jgi:protein-tyrosine-phosphatase
MKIKKEQNILNSEDELFYSPISTYKTLIICKGNTCRSVMFQSYLKKIKPKYEVFSAGVEIKEKRVEEKTLKTLLNNEIFPAKLKTESIEKFKEIKFDKIFILDETIELNKKNFYLIREENIININFKDPYKLNEEEYNKVFKDIKKYIDTIYK